MKNQKCVLYDRECTNCGECDICDLNPSKICDNCGKCIDSGNDYNIIDVDLIPGEGDEPHNYEADDELLEDEAYEEDELWDEAADSDGFWEYSIDEAADDEPREDEPDETDENDLRNDFGELF